MHFGMKSLVGYPPYSNEITKITLLDGLFGKFDSNDDCIILNHIILSVKFCIFRCKLDNSQPSLAVFNAKLRAIYKFETLIARKNDALLKHYS